MEVKMVVSGKDIPNLIKNVNTILGMIKFGKREFTGPESKFSFSSKLDSYTFSSEQKKQLDDHYDAQMDNFESAHLAFHQITNNEKTDYSNVTIGDVDRVEDEKLILKSKL